MRKRRTTEGQTPRERSVRVTAPREPSTEQSPELFALFLKLRGRLCLVVGAGRVAEPKIESLRRAGARVRVVAPEATAAIRAAARSGAASGNLVWLRRVYRPSDLRGAFLVVAATSSPQLHEQIFRQARRAGILCNSVDEPERCDFYYPAVVRRGPLQIAISTSGNAPALAARLRRELEAELERRFPAGYGAWVQSLGKARAKLLAGPPSNSDRSAARSAILQLSSDAAFRRFQGSFQRRAGRPSAKTSLAAHSRSKP